MVRSNPPTAGEVALFAHGRLDSYFFSYGDLDLLCASCGFTLFRGLPRLGPDHRLLAECPGCGDFMSATV